MSDELRLQLAHPLDPASAHLFAADLAAEGSGQGAPLDYSRESLAFLDSVLASLRDTGVTPDRVPEVLLGIGCYLGEAIARATGALWVSTAGTPVEGTALFPMLVRLPGGAACDPAGYPFAALAGPASATLIAFYDTVTTPTG
ncbi:MAG: hypothetical protein JWM51_704 [Microbacteriaceae bacterium]|nr:hypothetical protein [Microbacteriaceae bacterium]